MKRNRTYISLFSSAGVGCFGFKEENFSCIATNEIIERRLNIQKINNKCKYQSGYICGDITSQEIQERILNEIEFWKKNELVEKLDVLMATPPCQGMSTANYKKGDEINRNSLVVEAIHLINKIEPRIFIFENVRAFLTTMCIDKNNEALTIKDCIFKHLGNKYNIYGKVVNFMDYGIPSSRPRTIVIGTLKNETNFSPLNLFPLKKEHVTLNEAIGDLISLKYGERDKNDLYHSFRKYPKYMQEWIHELKEGETAFNNCAEKMPYKIINGERQILKAGYMGNKFCRMFWNRPAPCITTRNDQLASQTTIHPSDDRVLSIRELMRVMTVPDSFKWVSKETIEEIDKNETLIRQSIGEAVPTNIIKEIAKNINILLDYDDFLKYKKQGINLEDAKNNDNFYIKSYIYENELSNNKETGSFYTPQAVVYNVIKDYTCSKGDLKILEPSVGLGAFIPQFLRIVDDCDNIEFDLVDISQSCLDLLNIMIKEMQLNKKFKFNFICDDFILHSFEYKYDAIISNPPFYRLNLNNRKIYKDFNNVRKYDNIYCLFLDKFTYLTDNIMCVIPKNFLMVPNCNEIRNIYEKEFKILSIYDYGVDYFKNVFIEIISIYFFKSNLKNQITYIENRKNNIVKKVNNDYIYHDKIWLLYRDDWFDDYISKMELDVFDFYRDRQLTNKFLSTDKNNIWVLRSKNLTDDGKIIHKEGYDKYINSLDGFLLEKYYDKNSIIFTNFTYKTRATILPKKCTVNGSFCILIPKSDKIRIDLKMYSTEDFRKYYAIVKNLSKFTINVDNNIIYYIGVKKND